MQARPQSPFRFRKLTLADLASPLAGVLLLSLPAAAEPLTTSTNRPAQAPRSGHQQTVTGTKTNPQPVATEYAGAIRTRYAEILKGRDFDNEIAMATRAIATNPGVANYYIFRGDVQRMKGDYALAEKDYDKAISISPTFGTAYNNRGLNSLWRGDIDKAIADFDRAMALIPDNGTVKKFRDNAIAAKQFPGNSETAFPLAEKQMIELVRQGNELVTKRDYASAIDRYNRALTVANNNWAVLYLRANTYAKNQEYERAIADYSRMLTVRPTSAELFNTRGVAYKQSGDPDKAMADYNRALSFDLGYIPAINNRGIIFNERREYDRAIVEFDRVLSAKPNDAMALVSRARS